MTSFFVSYTSIDQSWAEWIAWAVEEAGHTAVLQAWDFRAGSNFVLEMQEAAARCDQTIAVLSWAYLKSGFTAAEWAAAFARDPAASQRKLVPVRIEKRDPDGLLKGIVYIDLVDLDEDAAKARLLAGISPGRAKPKAAPAFPGTRAARSHPTFPSAGVSTRAATTGAYMPRVRREFSDLDRTNFIREAFGTIGEGFRRRLGQLAQENPGTDVDLQDVTASKFTCEVFVNGQARASCKIWIGSSFSARGEIGYAAGKTQFNDDSSYNELLHVAQSPHDLKLLPMGMAMYARVEDLPKDGLTAEQAAEYLWRVFAWQLER